MLPELTFSLEHGCSYTQIGNIFSKSLIIRRELSSRQKMLLVVDNQAQVNQYKKHFSFLKIDFCELQTQADLLELIAAKKGFFIVDNFSLSDKTLPQSQLEYNAFTVSVNDKYDINNCIKKLTDIGYNYSDFGVDASYKRTGDVLSIIDNNGHSEYRISFWGEDVEEINKISGTDGIKTEKIEKLWLGNFQKKISDTPVDMKGLETVSSYAAKSGVFIVLDSLDFSENYDNYVEQFPDYCSFDFIGKTPRMVKNLSISSPLIEGVDELKALTEDSKIELLVYTNKVSTIKNFIDYNDLPKVSISEVKGNFLKSFQIDTLSTGKKKQIYICDDILGKIFVKKRLNKNLSRDLDLLLKIQPGDYVVHIDHGIGKFNGIVKKELPGGSGNSKRIIIKEYIEIHYKGEDKLFVPITEVARVNKFVGGEHPKLTALNTTEWQRKLKKVDESIQRLAEELLEIYSKRQIGSSFSFIGDAQKESDFRASFPYNYTPDQEEVIGEILQDMEKPQPMDRLLVGDVGFGKTEVAFNAIYRCFMNKKQSVLISPLVVLAYEHYEKSLERFTGMGLKIAVITRMESAAKVKQVLQGLSSGEIDLVIGTHKLLQDTICYKNLGLLVVDEEHKFGVSDKEKIKKLKSTIDILSMSATPIPRSLNMALSQIRQISVIKTPPFGRKDIETTISKFSERVIMDACIREFERGGQVYFVHNRVQTLVHFEKILQGIFPDKKIIITHGQLPGDRLEKRIIEFKNKKYDILLTTTVIENGIDFPNVNTIFINDAQNFGISQIHQLRGRVGRSEKQGYCYLLYKRENLSPETVDRLKTIVNYSYLGAGFELAMKDLEIRGGGDLLGCRQSGQSSEIGVNLYLKMIEKKIHELQSNKANIPSEKQIKTSGNILDHNVKIELNLAIGIPDRYFDSDLDKINFYREIESLHDMADLENLITDFSIENNIGKSGENRDNRLPKEMATFFLLLKIKLYAQKYKISHIKKSTSHYQLDFSEKTTLDDLKAFLDLDTEVKFAVVTPLRVRSGVKNFTNEENFLEYMLELFEKRIGRKKIKLKK